MDSTANSVHKAPSRHVSIAESNPHAVMNRILKSVPENCALYTRKASAVAHSLLDRSGWTRRTGISGMQFLQNISSGVFRGAGIAPSRRDQQSSRNGGGRSPENRRATASSVDVFAPPLTYLDDYNRHQKVLAGIKTQAFGSSPADSRIQELESRSIRKLETSASTRGIRGHKSSPAQ